MSHINNIELLAALLDGPYSDFREIGQDDWRDPNENNAGFSLSSKGYTDHKFGTSGSLYVLAQKHNLSILKRQLFVDTLVHEGDRIEIVNFVGGG